MRLTADVIGEESLDWGWVLSLGNRGVSEGVRPNSLTFRGSPDRWVAPDRSPSP